MTKQINVHVWSVVFEDDDTSWAAPIIGATREQAHDGTLAYLIAWLEEHYEYYDDCLVNWSKFTCVDDIVVAANQEGFGFHKFEIESSIHTLKASDLEYKEAEA